MQIKMHFQELFAYSKALLKHWMALMMGPVMSIVIPLMQKCLPNDSPFSKELPNWFYWLIVLIFILIASYFAWRDRQRELLKITSSEFIGQINLIVHRKISNTKLEIYVGGIITRRFGFPTSITNWEMKLRFPDDRSISGAFKIRNGMDERVEHLTFPFAKYWPNMSTDVIQQGRSLEGWISCIFEVENVDDALQNNPSIELSITDAVSQKPYTLCRLLPTENIRPISL